MSLASYSFLPWLRQGVVNTIATADGDTSVHTRASTHVDVLLSGDPIGGGAALTQTISRDVALYGPGDIVGIDTRAILRTEPRDWITNFEANYLAAVDFYDEDFPWRYTPAAPDGSGLKLRPWLALVVLKDGEFEEGRNLAARPLPYVTLANAALLPPAGELWAWAHVHFNESLAGSDSERVSPDMSAVLPRVESILAGNRDAGYARLLCPRRLEENTAYHAFVLPTFETGRLAGLGQDPATAPYATASAWAAYSGRPEPTNYPVYFRWFFRTGDRGDFEYLVRLLKPQPVDKRVGTRDIDVQDPGSNLPPIAAPALHGILRLGGALRVPDADLGPTDLAERATYENWDQPYPDGFEQAVAAFVDLPDDYAAASPTGDPLITAPLYGRWHSLTQRLLTQRDGTPAPHPTNWVHRLNLDPRFRVPAAFGTDVVETNAEQYMNYAWEQIGDVLSANHLIRRLHLATAVSGRLYANHLLPLAAALPERGFAVTAPVASRVMASPTTIAHELAGSVLAPAYTSAAMRRVVRPRARLMRSLPFDAAVTPNNLLSRVNAGEVAAAPPKTVPAGVPTLDQAAAAAEPAGVPVWLSRLLARLPWLALLLLGLAVLIALVLLVVLPLPVAIAVDLVLLGAAAYAYRVLRRWRAAGAAVAAISEADQTPAAVDRLPNSPDFTLAAPGSTVRPHVGASDSATAARFKQALRDSFALRAASAAASPAVALQRLDLPVLTEKLLAAVDPAVAIPRRGRSLVSLPSWISDQLVEDFGEVMAYPKIDLPMYEPLKAISVELFLPNINLIAPNSITLIETNQRFIESYMVGLNHEFARKLLWREFPTDERGSYFRQFWDVRGHIDASGLSGDPLKEKLYDIPKLHTWSTGSNLGEHNNRAAPGHAGEEQAVLVIRGELLKKYPTAVIYAQRAAWVRAGDNSIDLTKARTLVGADNPPMTDPTVVRTPLYEAKADPDIYFFGFDLTIDEVKGGSGENPTDDPGWFFVIKQRPGEPRFGLEVDGSAPEIFDDLSWADAGTVAGANLSAAALANPVLASATTEKQQQHTEDLLVAAAPASSARWAYLLYRAPVMVAVHADEMLSV
jgi:hypothetical protein